MISMTLREAKKIYPGNIVVIKGTNKPVVVKDVVYQMAGCGSAGDEILFTLEDGRRYSHVWLKIIDDSLKSI